MPRRRNLLLLMTLLLAGLALMAWAWQPFRVVGHSMEPGLIEGDWLLLDHRTPARDDFVVFREPGSGLIAVKRVAGVPGERVQLVNGDLYLDGKVRPRALSSIEDLVPMIDVEGPAADQSLRLADHGFQLTDANRWKLEGSAVAYLKRPPAADYLLRGEHVAGTYPATDLGLEVEYELLSPTSALHLALRKGQSTFLAVLSEDGTMLRILQQDPDTQTPVILFETNLADAHPVGSAFFTLADQRFTFVLDDEVLIADLPYPTPLPHRLSEVPPDFSNFEHAGVGGVGPLLVGRIRMGRDILYRSSGIYAGSEAFQLADGQYFLLGDNPTESRDSRQYGAVPRARILGTVSSRVWPRGWSERGWRLE